MWSGDAQGEFDRRTIPAFSRFRNSASAIRCFSGSRHLALAKTGLPVVSIVWKTPCFGFGVPDPSPTMAGKEARSERTAGVMWQSAAANPDWRGPDTDPEIGSRDVASKTWPKCGSTRRRLADRKSTPRIGLETAARMKVQRKVRTPKFNVFLTEPQDEIDFPSAPERGGPVEGCCEVCGKTLTAAPVSTRNFCFVFVSCR